MMVSGQESVSYGKNRKYVVLDTWVKVELIHQLEGISEAVYLTGELICLKAVFMKNNGNQRALQFFWWAAENFKW